ncbi:hypothetical protein CcCBS67573_g01133 [Chytriomyces confervae]|uniref:F-box domain-containing protein n=1 Tax=Chytriomyces confervae TaxID=246404 RepID=A0A507FMQ3_9FUNG|nr:hypothetical protein HDU80_006925 [Chytriomyces hyalinus]TPX77604.1 hypothetical protein CcCBS67573_g01133 [Chytriomyces confervae]
MLASLPHELLTQIASHMNCKQSLLHLACSNRALLSASAPVLWHRPRLSPLVSLSAWRRFLDAVAASNTGLTACNYASFVHCVEDLGLCIGAEDACETQQDEHACLYAYPSKGDLLERHDSKFIKEHPDLDLESISSSLEQDLPPDLVCDSTSAPALEPVVPQQSCRIRRVHLFIPGTAEFIMPHPTESLHYALSLLLTHCPNIQSLNIQLPLPPITTPFPLKLSLLPSLTILDISTRVTDAVFESIFDNPPIPTRLHTLKLQRLELYNEALLSTHLLTRLNKTTLETLILPSPSPPSRSMTSQLFSTASSHLRTRPPRRDTRPRMTYSAVIPLLTHFSHLVHVDVSTAVPSLDMDNNNNTILDNEDTASPLLSAISKLCHITKLTLSVSRAGGVSVQALCSMVLPNLSNLQVLTLKATTDTRDYTGDSTVEEEEIMDMPVFWAGRGDGGGENGMKRLVLVGLDFVRGGEGVMRSYYSCAGGDLGMVAEFRMRFERVHGDRVQLSILNW